MTELLMANGADYKIKDKHGNTAKVLAEKKGNKAILDLLPG
jgi:ankyrin repeat protein